MSYTPDDAFGLLRSYSRHRDFVRLALGRVAYDLQERATVHDASKMSDDEFAGFARINAAARTAKFGSAEYAESMQRERGTIDMHFARNSHHPECHAEHPEHRMNCCDKAHDMTFLDVVEMVCDWWGARKGYNDARPWAESVELNLTVKGKYLSPEQVWLVRQVATFLERL